MPTQAIKEHKKNSKSPDNFIDRHSGSDAKQIQDMLKEIQVDSFDSLIDKTIPSGIRLKKKLTLPIALTEFQALKELKSIASKNKVFKSFIGQGYYPSILPAVIQRTILENPGWYTAYTPYQAEISQGRLETLMNFQTMITDLTGLEIANASLLDEGTAAAEAMHMAFGMKKNDSGNQFLVSDKCFQQTIDVVKTRAEHLGIKVIVADENKTNLTKDFFGILLQNPGRNGELIDYTALISSAHTFNIVATVATDLLTLTLLKTPGEMGADIAIGSTQRFGLPMGFGGPHAGFFATRDEYKRNMPGRLIGLSIDANGNPAYRMALQTREQHIRRDKATSNICTSQVLLAVISSMYAVYHGPERLKNIAMNVHQLTLALKNGLEKLGYTITNQSFFDTITIETNGKTAEIKKLAVENEFNFFYDNFTNSITISLDETVTGVDIKTILTIFNQNKQLGFDPSENMDLVAIPSSLTRKTDYLTHPVFNSYHTETKMLRYIKKLESKDLSLTASMIPLGSCTMKLNAAAEMYPISWPEFAGIHPLAPNDQTLGYLELFQNLENWLAEITGFTDVSLQPNAGSQGEYAGLLAIREYYIKKKESHRNICLIPVSAHGTNPASAVMAGFKVVAIACDATGNIEVSDLKAKAEAHKDNLATLMVTYPSTHGVFEEDIIEICEIIHQFGGQIYMDGANMNAQVGLCRPGDIGADVCHLNLHKTFSIPHGGGGPGVGPICVKPHLAKYLPGHSLIENGTHRKDGSVTSSPWGSASVLPISWMYIRMTGEEGLTHSTRLAILNANYIAKRLENYFPVLYRGKNGFVAHECIIDFRKFKSTAKVEVEDIAKRLMDYGFHAPTMSWPVPGTLMVEPTESESKEELDRFCDVMLSIHQEIMDIENGKLDLADNMLKNSPHTIKSVSANEWKHAYSREQAAWPVKSLLDFKFWPASARIDNVYGDRNLICTCQSVESYTN